MKIKSTKTAEHADFDCPACGAWLMDNSVDAADWEPFDGDIACPECEEIFELKRTELPWEDEFLVYFYEPKEKYPF